MLHDMVRVIGYEVASIYGGDVRHRDANWIYGVELAELVSRFPLSRDSLSSALKEVGSVQLLNEYDRIFLYRCLAAHRSAHTFSGTASRDRIVTCADSDTFRAPKTKRGTFYFFRGLPRGLTVDSRPNRLAVRFVQRSLP